MPQGSSAVRPTNGLYLYLYLTMIIDAVFSSANVAPTCLATKFLVACYGYLTTLSVTEFI